jgi:hypothetical protein
MRRALTSFMSTVGVAGLLSAGALTVVAPAASAETCPNDAFRTGYSAALPDCRAYELVSPPGLQPYFTTFGSIANVSRAVAIVGSELGTTASQGSDRGGIAFFSTVARPGSPTDGPYYLSSRGTQGWSTREDLIPPTATQEAVACLPYINAWSSNLERGVLEVGFSAFHPIGVTCAPDEPELVPGEPRGGQDLFLRDNSSGAYQLINQPGLSGEPTDAIYQGGSSDLGIVAFSEETKFASQVKYYVWAGGTMDRLLTILPNGQPTEGAIANAATLTLRGAEQDATSPTFSHAVAPDGSRIEFTAGGNLYSRVNPGAPQSGLSGAEECIEPSKACTVEIDSSEPAGAGGGGVFTGSSGADGSVVYFTDTNRLTTDSTATAGDPDLYEYDFNKPVGNRLTDLTVDGNGGEHADVLGYVGTNETGTAGEYVYFVATGILASEPNSGGAFPMPEAPNLYGVHEGTTRFIATLSLVGDSCDWENTCMSARVSPNGRYLGFDSLQQLTGVNNLDAATNEPDQNIFFYDGEAEELSCASCGTSGAAPVAPASIRSPESLSTIALPLAFSLQRNVSDNGQVFFDTPNPLLPAARNGQNLYSQSNVYEFEKGHLHLLSSGTAESSSFFYDASADGGDVYLITQQALVPGASATELAVYDARIGGGFPPGPQGPEPCSGDACSGAQSIAPRLPTISSTAVFGQGNLEPAVSKPVAVKSLSNAQKLAKALKSCRAKRNRHKRGVCEAQARKRYGPRLKKKSAKTNRRGK